MCARSRPFWAACFLVLCFSAADGCWAEESLTTSGLNDSPPLNAISPNTGSEQPESWTNLEQLLTELETEANAQAEDLRKLLGQLAESQTALSESSILLRQSEAQLTSLREAMMNERDQARSALKLAIDKGARAEQSCGRWRIAGIIGIGAAALEAVVIGLIVALR